MNVAAIIISVLSLLVAIASLYISHLRSSRIELDKTNLDNDTDTRMLGGWNGVWPTPGFVIYFKLYIQNLGNKTGSFEGIKTKLLPDNFSNFSLGIGSTLYSDKVGENGHYISLGERRPIEGGSVIPVMLGVTFTIKEGVNLDDHNNFTKLWKELKDLRKQNEPTVALEYVVKELSMFGNAKSKAGPIQIQCIAERIIQVLAGSMGEIPAGNPYYDLAQKCLSDLK